jgi:Aldehyde oxidase and xanthine dehydrogenase, a/b hammerhead domain
MHAPKFGISQSVTRKEDDALLRGRGRYVADVAPAGALHAAVLRSPHAHARFTITDTAVARGLSGVHLVLTASDLAAVGEMPCGAIPEGVTVDVPPYPVLARDVVRHVGDAVAFVVADTVEQARDAAEAITIDRRGRNHRRRAGGDERDRRCALPRVPHPPCRHARDPGTGMGRDPGGKARSHPLKDRVGRRHSAALPVPCRNC